jgi:L-rhamnose isomerase
MLAHSGDVAIQSRTIEDQCRCFEIGEVHGSFEDGALRSRAGDGLNYTGALQFPLCPDKMRVP